MSAASGNRLRGYLELGRTRRRSVRAVGRAEKDSRRETTDLALENLIGAVWALRLLPRNIGEYLKDTGITGWRGRGRPALLADLFSEEIKKPPKEKTGNPLKDAREAAVYLITSPGIRNLQGRIVGAAWEDWFGLYVTEKQAAVLGSYSDVAWLSRGLMKTAGVSLRAGISPGDKRRLKVVLAPFVHSMNLRRAHLEGLSRPGRALLAAWFQSRRLGRLRRSGFAPDDMKVLYPDIIDIETLSHRRQAVVSLKNEYLRNIRVRSDGRRFENYMHLQTLIMGAPSRGPVRLGRFMAAVERRHT